MQTRILSQLENVHVDEVKVTCYKKFKANIKTGGKVCFVLFLLKKNQHIIPCDWCFFLSYANSVLADKVKH